MADIELTAAQARELQGMDQAIKSLSDSLDRAERAGLDVAGLRLRLAETNARREGLLREFSPAAAARRHR